MSEGEFEFDDLPARFADNGGTTGAAVDVEGSWEVVRGASGAEDFVYASIPDPHGTIAGFQVYIQDADTLYLMSDPDHGPRLVLARRDGARDTTG